MLYDYSWEDVQFRVNQVPTNRLITIHPGMKNNEIQNLYLQVLCDRLAPEEVVDNLKDSYEAFQERLDLIKQGV